MPRSGEFGDFELRSPRGSLDEATRLAIVDALANNASLDQLKEVYGAEAVELAMHDPEIQELADPTPEGGGYAA